MTADAKVGLLLGLFFIVIIAFLVNGLPNFIKQEHPTTADAAILTTHGSGEPQAWIPRLNFENTVTPEAEAAPAEAVMLDTTHSADRVTIPDLPQTAPTDVASHEPMVVDTTQLINTSRQTPASQTPAPAAGMRIHTVAKGEILPVIAKKYYGDEEGNRRVVIQKLYELNKNVLKSPDSVRVGDELKIPSSVGALLGTQNTVTRTPSTTQRLLDRASNLLEPVTANRAASVSEYVVQEGDSLWSIAQKKLGDGKLYTEIKKLNKITNDELQVGERIKLPAQ